MNNNNNNNLVRSAQGKIELRLLGGQKSQHTRKYPAIVLADGTETSAVTFCLVDFLLQRRIQYRH